MSYENRLRSGFHVAVLQVTCHWHVIWILRHKLTGKASGSLSADVKNVLCGYSFLSGTT